jgi:hypothetical protein
MPPVSLLHRAVIFCAVFFLVLMPVWAGLPRQTFEIPVSAGRLPVPWQSVGAVASVTDLDSFTGEQSLLLSPPLTDAVPEVSIPAVIMGDAPGFIDLWIKPVARTLAVHPPGQAAAGQPTESSGVLYLDGAHFLFQRQGNRYAILALNRAPQQQTLWVRLGGQAGRPADYDLEDAGGRAKDWLRLTVRRDLVAGTYDVWVNQILAGVDLALDREATGPELRLQHRPGMAPADGGLAAMLLDDVFASADNPLYADADRDALPDVWEATHDSLIDPALPRSVAVMTSDRAADDDLDRVPKISEYFYGSFPTHPDSDGDGMGDAMEIEHGLDPGSRLDASWDLDADGFSNLAESQGQGDGNISVPPAGSLTNVVYIKADHTGLQTGDFQTPYRTIGAALRSTRLSDGGRVVIRGEGGPLTHFNASAAAENAPPTFDNGGLMMTRRLHLMGVNAARVDLQGAATFATVTIPGTFSSPALVCENISFENCRGEDGAVLRVVGTTGEVVVRQCRVSSCDAADDGGAIYAHGASLTIDDCWFERCGAAGDGGAVLAEGGTQALVRRSHFEVCAAEADGGAFCVRGVTVQPVLFESCVFQKNVGWRGGALSALDGADAEVRQCTVAGNSAAATSGGGAFFGSSTASLLNASGCIFWNNSAGGVTHSHLASGMHAIDYSTFSGWTLATGPAGVGNNGSDPVFREGTLLPTSTSALDSSNPAHSLRPDFFHNPRWDAPGGTPGVIVDRGAFEQQPDSDGDGMSDDWEKRYALQSQNASDADADADQDGYSNYEEWIDKTDPSSAASLKAAVIYVHPVAGRDWHPGPNAPSGTPVPALQGGISHPFKSIKRAILACAPHRRIVLLDGSYAGLLNTNLKLAETWVWTPHLASTALTSTLSLDTKTIRGLNGAGRVTLDAGAATRCFDLGLSAKSIWTQVTLQNLTMRRGWSDLGGAIRVAGMPGYGKLVLERCLLNANRATTSGGAIHVVGAGLTMVHCVLSGNEAPQGGALSLLNLAPVGSVSYSFASIHHSRLAYNAATGVNASSGQGGAVCAYASYFALTQTRLDHNMAQRHGGGLAILSPSAYYPPAVGEGTVMEFNSALERGGAVYSENAPFTATAAKFIGNLAGSNGFTGEGGAVFLAHPAPVTTSAMGHSSRTAQFLASQFRLNQAGLRGGAVAIADASPLLTNCAFTENHADASGGIGGAVAVFWQVPLVANPSVPAHSSAPRFVHTTFTGNQSSLAANLHAAVLTTPWLINSIFSDGLVRPASPTLVGPRQLHGCLLAAPDAIASPVESSVARRNQLGSPLLAFDGIHLAAPVRPASDTSSLSGGIEPGSSASFVRPLTDMDNDVRPVAVSGKFTLMRGCDEPRDADNDSLPDWFETLALAFASQDAFTTLAHTHPVTPSSPTPHNALPTNNADGDAYTLTQELFYGGQPDRPESIFSGHDADGDGLSDLHERLTPGLHWLNPDINGDGIVDGWAIRHFGGLTVDPEGDPDGDGLSNQVEAVSGTSPIHADSDGDGVPDAWELATGSDPGRTDSDGDGHPDVWGAIPLDASGQLPSGLHQPSAAEPWYIEQGWSYFESKPGNYFYSRADASWGLDSMNEASDTFMQSQLPTTVTDPAGMEDFCLILKNTLGAHTPFRPAVRVNPSLLSISTHQDDLSAHAKLRFQPMMQGLTLPVAQLTTLLAQPRTTAWAAQWQAQVKAAHTAGLFDKDHGRASQRWAPAAISTGVVHEVTRFVPTFRLRSALPNGAPKDVSVTFLRFRGRSAQTSRFLTASASPVTGYPLDENAFTLEPVTLTLAKGSQSGPILSLNPQTTTPLTAVAPTLPTGYPSPTFFEIHQFDRLLPLEIKVHQTVGGPEGSAPKYAHAPAKYNASNLFSLWPNEPAVVKIKLPLAAATLPPNLITWSIPGHTYGGNTLEAPVKWAGVSAGTKEILITIGGVQFKVHIIVQRVGLLSQAEAALLAPNAAPVMLLNRQEAIDFGALYPVGPKQDAMRHAYWCSLSASTGFVTPNDVSMISQGHEYTNRYEGRQQAFNSTIDLKNNAVGCEVIYQSNGQPNRRAIRAELERRYDAGEMYIWEVPDGAASPLQQASEGIVIKSNNQRIHP